MELPPCVKIHTSPNPVELLNMNIHRLAEVFMTNCGLNGVSQDEFCQRHHLSAPDESALDISSSASPASTPQSSSSLSPRRSAVPFSTCLVGEKTEKKCNKKSRRLHKQTVTFSASTLTTLNTNTNKEPGKYKTMLQKLELVLNVCLLAVGFK